MTPTRRVAGVVFGCILGALIAPTAAAQQAAQEPQPGTSPGVALDRADGSPIADVSVRLQDGGS